MSLKQDALCNVMMNMFCDLEPKDWLNVILTIIGILVSGFGLIIAICQICRMRKTSEAVHEEVIKSQKQIRKTLDSNEIGRAIKNLEQAISFVSREEYDHALTKLMDIKSMIENEEIIKSFLSQSDVSDFNFHKRRFNDSFKTIAGDVNKPDSIDRRIIQNSLSDIHNYFLRIENNIKASVYERKH